MIKKYIVKNENTNKITYSNARNETTIDGIFYNSIEGAKQKIAFHTKRGHYGYVSPFKLIIEEFDFVDEAQVEVVVDIIKTDRANYIHDIDWDFFIEIIDEVKSVKLHAE